MPQPLQIDHNGAPQSLRALARTLGVTHSALSKRRKAGIGMDALTAPSQSPPSRLLTARGETRTLAEWSAITGIRRGLITVRKDRGWTDEEALGFKSREPLPAVVRWLFDEMKRRDMTIKEVERKAGIGHNSIRYWLEGDSPFLESFMFAVWALGHEIKLGQEHARTTHDLAGWLQDHARRKGVSQRELARRSGCDHAPISRFLSGKRSMTLRSFLLLLKALDLKFPAIVPKRK